MGGTLAFFSPCELPTRPEGTRKALMIYIYNPKLTWNAGYLGDLCHQFEWLRVFLMRFGWLHMPLSDNGALSGSWMALCSSHGSAWIKRKWVCLAQDPMWLCRLPLFIQHKKGVHLGPRTSAYAAVWACVLVFIWDGRYKTISITPQFKLLQHVWKFFSI